MKKLLVALLISTGVFVSCNQDNGETKDPKDNFNRQAMLINWADNIIIPAYEKFQSEVDQMQASATTFAEDATLSHLEALRSEWTEAYIAWQSVSMFEIGKAEEITFRNYINIYPVEVDALKKNIETSQYNLTSVNKQDEQGFPALDYLLHGLATSDEDILTFYTSHNHASGYKKYLVDIADRIQALTNQVVEDWKGTYRTDFIENDGNSGTSSVNKMVNDYLFYYEKFLRAGKIGIPAGVFSDNPIPTSVEAFYKGDFSKTLFNASLNAAQDFFNGKHFGDDTNGESFKTYLVHLTGSAGDNALDQLINSQFETARQTSTGLSDSFAEQVETNNSLMLSTYDELQKLVVLMKVDMRQLFNVKIDYVDADGD